MKHPIAILLASLLCACATKEARYPAPEPCQICDASTSPRHDAPVRLFNDNILTPCGRPHPGWTPALRERMARERAVNPTQTPMDYATAHHDPARPLPVPVGFERELLLWKPPKH